MINLNNEKYSNHKTVLALISTIIFMSFLTILMSVYINRPVMTIVAKFEKLPPIPRSLTVYYKGYKIGKTHKIVLSNDSKYTLLYLNISKRDLKLPDNIIAKLRMPQNKTIKNYIEIIYPKNPSGVLIKNNDQIIGKSPLNVQDYIDELADSNNMNNVVNNFTGAMNNANQSSEKMNKIADLVIVILTENRNDIRRIVNNTANTTAHVNKITANVEVLTGDKGVKQDFKSLFKSAASTSKNIDTLSKDEGLKSSISYISKTTQNIQESSTRAKNITTNIESITKNVDETTRNLNDATKNIKDTFKKVDTTLNEAQCTIENANHLTCGVSKMLSKKFLVPQLVFGQPGAALKNPPCCKKSCKKQ